MRAASAEAGIAFESGRAGACGRAAGRSARGAAAAAGAEAPDFCVETAGRTSYARRLMFSRCFGEMLSEVMLPPQPPQPSVIAGSSPVVRPMEPCVVGV